MSTTKKLKLYDNDFEEAHQKHVLCQKDIIQGCYKLRPWARKSGFSYTKTVEEERNKNIKRANHRAWRYNKRNPSKEFDDEKIRHLMGIGGLNEHILSFVGDEPFLYLVSDPSSWLVSDEVFLPDEFLLDLKPKQRLLLLSKFILKCTPTFKIRHMSWVTYRTYVPRPGWTKLEKWEGLWGDSQLVYRRSSEYLTRLRVPKFYYMHDIWEAMLSKFE